MRTWSCRWLAALTLSCCALASAAAAQPCPDLPFRPNVPVPGLTSPVRFAIADFNEDGHRDLAVTNRTDDVTIHLGDGAGAFTFAGSHPAGRFPGHLVAADFDADGHADLAVGTQVSPTSGSLAVLLGTGTGSFGPATHFTFGSGTSSLAVDDFNEDGIVDLALVDWPDLWILLGTGSGSFNAATTSVPGGNPSVVAAGDLDRDGHTDLVVDLTGHVAVLHGTGLGTFLPAGLASIVGTGAKSIVLHDFNHDGALDAAVGLWLYHPSLVVLLNDGLGGFRAPTLFPCGSDGADLAVADFDGDGHDDVAVSNFFDDAVSVVRGTGTGAFHAPASWPVGKDPLAVAAVDFDEDGRPDLVTSTSDVYNPTSLMLRFNGCTPGVRDGTFERGQPWPDWTVQTSTQFATPLCNPGLCGDGGGTAPPFGGANWAWFGGTPDVPETASLGQSVVLPPSGELGLQFQMRSGFVSAPATDSLVVSVDGTPVAAFPEPPSAEMSYAPRLADVTAFADGAAHALLFTYRHPDPLPASFTVDDVRLVDREAVFADGFERGLSAWSRARTDGFDLSTRAAAALAGTSLGLQARVDDANGLFVQDDTPADEDGYHARFDFDPNGFDPGESAGRFRTRMFILFEDGPALRRLAAVVLRRRGGQFSVMARARLDDEGQANTPWIDIADGPHRLALHWRRASSSGASDGLLRLWIDGASAGDLAGLENARGGVDFVRLGALSVKTGAWGRILLDEFVSTRPGPTAP